MSHKKIKYTFLWITNVIGSLYGILFANLPYENINSSLNREWISYNSYAFVTIELDSERASTFGDLFFLDECSFLDLSSYKVRGEPAFLALEHGFGIKILPHFQCYHVGYIGIEKGLKQSFFSERIGAVLQLPVHKNLNRKITSELVFGSPFHSARSLLAHSLVLSAEIPINNGSLTLSIGTISRFERNNSKLITSNGNIETISCLKPGNALFISPSASYKINSNRTVGICANTAFLMSDRNNSKEILKTRTKTNVEFFYIWAPDNKSNIKIGYKPTCNPSYTFGTLTVRAFYIR